MSRGKGAGGVGGCGGGGGCASTTSNYFYEEDDDNDFQFVPPPNVLLPLTNNANILSTTTTSLMSNGEGNNNMETTTEHHLITHNSKKRTHVGDDNSDSEEDEDFCFLNQEKGNTDFIEALQNTQFVVHQQGDLPEFDWYTQAEIDAENYWIKKREQEKADYDLAFNLQQQEERENEDDLPFPQLESVQVEVVDVVEDPDEKLARELALQFEAEIKGSEGEDEKLALALSISDANDLITSRNQQEGGYGFKKPAKKFPKIHHKRIKISRPDKSEQLLKTYASFNTEVSLNNNFEFNPETYFTNLHDRVVTAFKKKCPKYSVLSIEPANANTTIKQRFVATWKELASQGKQVAPILCFHGTAKKNFPSILKNGLVVPGQENSVRVANGSAHGVGIYLSVIPSISIKFCKKGNQMFICACILGSKFVTSPDGTVIVAFENTHVMPCFILTFEKNQYFVRKKKKNNM